MSGWLWVPVIWLLASMMITPVNIGKPRQPLDGGTAAGMLLIQGALVACILRDGGVL